MSVGCSCNSRRIVFQGGSLSPRSTNPQDRQVEKSDPSLIHVLPSSESTVDSDGSNTWMSDVTYQTENIFEKNNAFQVVRQQAPVHHSPGPSYLIRYMSAWRHVDWLLSIWSCNRKSSSKISSCVRPAYHRYHAIFVTFHSIMWGSLASIYCSWDNTDSDYLQL